MQQFTMWHVGLDSPRPLWGHGPGTAQFCAARHRIPDQSAGDFPGAAARLVVLRPGPAAVRPAVGTPVFAW